MLHNISFSFAFIYISFTYVQNIAHLDGSSQNFQQCRLTSTSKHVQELYLFYLVQRNTICNYCMILSNLFSYLLSIDCKTHFSWMPLVFAFPTNADCFYRVARISHALAFNKSICDFVNIWYYTIVGNLKSP